jgi:hypothetical protein
MTEDRTSATSNADDTRRTRTVVIEDKRHSSSLSGLLMVALVLIAVIVAVWAVTRMGGAEAAKDNAIAEAANDVGHAAQQVGEAAQGAGQAVEDAARNAGRK